MLIWKVIAASPGITRAQIWEQVEHSIPEGYAIRLYMRNGAPWITDPSLIQGRSCAAVCPDRRPEEDAP